MPQLDFIIIFPQIFWLLLTFFFVYAILISFFLPFFVKSLKARKQISYKNIRVLDLTKTKFNNTHKSLQNWSSGKIYLTKSLLKNEIFSIDSHKLINEPILMNLTLTNGVYNTTLYYGTKILNFTLLNFQTSNLKFN